MKRYSVLLTEDDDGKIKPDIVERRYIEDTQNGDAEEGDAK